MKTFKNLRYIKILLSAADNKKLGKNSGKGEKIVLFNKNKIDEQIILNADGNKLFELENDGLITILGKKQANFLADQ